MWRCLVAHGSIENGHKPSQAVVSDTMFRLHSFPISVWGNALCQGCGNLHLWRHVSSICPCSTSCHTPSFPTTCALFRGSAAPVCEECLALCILTTRIRFAGRRLLGPEPVWRSICIGQLLQFLYIPVGIFPPVVLIFWSIFAWKSKSCNINPELCRFHREFKCFYMFEMFKY